MQTLQRFKVVLIIAIASSFFVNCHTESSGYFQGRENTFTRYSLIYYESLNLSAAEAEFFEFNEDGRKLNLNLSVPAKVTFDKSIQGVKFDDMRLKYYKNFSGIKKNVSVEFYYTSNNIPYINDIEMVNSVGLPISLSSVQKGAGLNFTFIGAPVAKNEQVILKINELTFTNNKEGSNSFDISSSELSSLPIGNAKVSILRMKRVPATSAPEAGGVLVSAYQSAEKTISIQ
ncbi:MAG: hypothetical protein RMJ53_01570 [Chitinophagales bacterium]|nr:hypothetical protein [Chitinophagales bacterium]MDW8272897.1 hypothetical protein [Chitinophagales bacterium]